MSALKPIYLLADSRLLFFMENGAPLLKRVRDAIDRERPRAAYVGAANGDDPAHYSIFEAAMDLAGVKDRRMIRVTYPPEEAAFLQSADVILLAGGDVARGWQAMGASGITQTVRDRYAEGAVLMGVSAGATLLGEKASNGDDSERLDIFDALGFLPWTVDTHDESNGWRRLRRVVSESGGGVRGLGLPAGSGLVWHTDQTVEPLRRPIIEVSAGDKSETLLLPGSSSD